VTRLKADNDALMDRLGPLMRVMKGASGELVALRRRARQLQTENARLREEIEYLRDRHNAPTSNHNGPARELSGRRGNSG
jgi:regulator of replication initiation timing